MSRPSTPAAGTPDGAGQPRRQRTDAKRSAAALLGAARTTFSESGVDVPAKQITDLAGVGVGTLYRHFPRRSDLIVAVLRHETDDCINAAGELGDSHGPREAVIAWIGRFREFLNTKQGLAAALHSGGPAYEGLPGQLLEQLVPALQGLLDRAAAAGEIREDVSAREIMMAVALLSQRVPDAADGFDSRMIAVLLDGLAARG